VEKYSTSTRENSFPLVNGNKGVNPLINPLKKAKDLKKTKN